MDFSLIRRGFLSGEVGPVRNYFRYIVRDNDTGEVVLDGYAGDLQEAVQSLDLCLDVLVQQGVAC